MARREGKSQYHAIPGDWPPLTYEAATAREWLVTNGLGGFAGSTLCGANTRRYHGLFVPALTPPTSRMVMVSKLEEAMDAGQGWVELGTNRYPGAIHPRGYEYLTAFERMPLPIATYSAGNGRLSKTVWMRHGRNVTIVRYANEGDTPIDIRLRPLLVCRDYHHLRRATPDMPFVTTMLEPGLWSIEPEPGSRLLWMRHTEGTFEPEADWYRNFICDKETERGLDDREDACCIGTLAHRLEPGQEVHLAFALAVEDLGGDPGEWRRDEIKRISSLVPKGIMDGFVRDLCVSGDQFLVRRGDGTTIIAGYPWFTDWGRDTMIAMRGLVIARGLRKTSRSIFRTFLAWTDRGMIPNRFPDAGETPEYNTIDATLWLFIALYEHVERFEDGKFVLEVLPKLEEIIDHHATGTRYGIGMKEDGLLCGGADNVQLTWMDAMVDGHVVTPRQGCPVEINALWYNALRILRAFKEMAGKETGGLDKMIRQVRASFRQRFVHPDGYLHDVIRPDGTADDAVRPNMIYAVSLPFSPLKKKDRRSVLARVTKDLYTDVGLRSLSPDHPEFKPDYGGSPWARDHAYHQGAVWAYLWGEWALACLRVNHFSDETCAAINARLATFRDHFYRQDALLAVSEIFDGGVPGPGRGCVQQAWSVGMLLRVLLDPDFRVD